MKGAKLFARWLSTVHKGLIEKTRSPIMSNSWRTPRIDTPSVSSPQSNKTLDFPLESSQTIVSYQLIQAMNRNNEVCKETNKIRQAEY
jgi:hypothetical protein